MIKKIDKRMKRIGGRRKKKGKIRKRKGVHCIGVKKIWFLSVATNSVILFFELFNPKLSKSKSGFVFRESSTKCYVFWIHCYGKYQIIFHSLLGDKLIVGFFVKRIKLTNFFSFLFYHQVNLITPQVKNVLHSNFTILFVTWS